jgi:hypothetical protein
MNLHGRAFPPASSSSAAAGSSGTVDAATPSATLVSGAGLTVGTGADPGAGAGVCASASSLLEQLPPPLPPPAPALAAPAPAPALGSSCSPCSNTRGTNAVRSFGARGDTCAPYRATAGIVTLQLQFRAQPHPSRCLAAAAAADEV